MHGDVLGGESTFPFTRAIRPRAGEIKRSLLICSMHVELEALFGFHVYLFNMPESGGVKRISQMEEKDLAVQ